MKIKVNHAIEILTAFNEGKYIQYKDGNSWLSIANEELILEYLSSGKYLLRVKPEQTYRPYNSAEEFLQASKEHGPYIITNSDKHIYLPVYVYEDKVSLANGATIGYDEMLQCDKWQDGIPCGILEN